MGYKSMVEIVPVHGSGEKRAGFFVDFYNQWPSILRPSSANWQDFNFTVFEEPVCSHCGSPMTQEGDA